MFIANFFMINRLFICSYGQVRSVTASTMFNGRHCGLYQNNKDIRSLCRWADEIYIFSGEHERNYEYFIRKYPEFADKITQTIDVMDRYGIVNDYRLKKRIRDVINLV